MVRKLTFTMLILVLVTGNILGGGFQVNEHGSRSSGMGGAFAAIANDPSAIFFNPAGILQLRGTNIMLGTKLIMPQASFRGPSPSIQPWKTESQVFTPSHFYITHSFNEDLAVGLGFNNPYGLGTTWDDNWVGRFVAVNTRLRTFNFTPVVAYKITDNIMVSAGLIYSYADVIITRKSDLSPFQGEASVELEGDEKAAFGYTAGILIKATDEFTIGAALRSNVNYEFSGTATTTGPSQVAAQLPNGDITATLTTPLNLTVGLGYQFSPEFTASADFQYVNWSSFDSLKVNFVDPKYSDLASPREYKNCYIARLGFQYNYDESLDLRAGVLYDNAPTPSDRMEPSLPDNDRIGISLGLGYKLTESLTVDFSYLYLRVLERTITDSKVNYSGNAGFAPLNGTYNVLVNLFGMSLSYNF